MRVKRPVLLVRLERTLWRLRWRIWAEAWREELREAWISCWGFQVISYLKGDVRWRQRIALENVHLETLDAAGQLGESMHDQLDRLELVIVQAEGRHDDESRAFPAPFRCVLYESGSSCVPPVAGAMQLSQ